MKRTIKVNCYGKNIYGRKNTIVKVNIELDRYFSMTLGVYSGGHMVNGGADHELIARLTPDKAKYLKWHLVSADGTPMHYIENALYWAGCRGWCDGQRNSPPHWDNFMSTIVWGGAPRDVEEYTMLSAAFEHRDEAALRRILEERLPALQQAFHDAMRDLFGEEYPY